MITSVGYRVKSKRGIQFRRWANQVLKDYIVKGYTINEVYCPAKYADDSSSINLRRSIKYGLLVIYYTFRYILKRK